MKKLLIFFLLSFALVVAPAKARDGLERVDIFYVSWELMARHNMSPDEVRKDSFVNVQINDSNEISKFLKSLKLNELMEAQTLSANGVDVRLVIDVYKPNGTKSTYFASAFRLYSEDGLKSKPVDNEFKKRFFSFIPSYN
jgi:hypothetical protein